MGTGEIFIVNEVLLPEQPLKTGVTVTVPEMFVCVPFGYAIHDGMFPVPLAASPIAVLVFAQLNAEPGGELVKLFIVICWPGQTVILLSWVTAGVGYIVTVNVITGPVQPLRKGVTVIVPVMFTLVLLDGAVQPGMFPAPLAARLMAVFELVHVKLPLEGVLLKFPIFIAWPGQTATLFIWFTVGVG